MIANKGTKVSEHKSVTEIQAMLVTAGATAVMIDYVDGKPNAIAFKITKGGNQISFSLRSNWNGLLEAMRNDKSVARSLVNGDQARRVSWRVLRDWIRAQLTLIESGSATIEEVMLPWAVMSDGNTVAQRMLTGPNRLLLLPAPQSTAR